jgi:hypothetical protein
VPGTRPVRGRGLESRLPPRGELLTNEGLGHTLVIHTRNQDVIRQFCRKTG